MNRKKMLNILHTAPFALIDPPSSWKDIGFTEHEIWVNAKGYGYIMCDEPTARGNVSGIKSEKWQTIRKKLMEKSLTFNDIEETSLIELLEAITFGEYCENDDPCEYLEGLLELPEEQIGEIYYLQTIDGWMFFVTSEALNRMLERDWCDYEWDDLSDEMLQCWINRLLIEHVLEPEIVETE